MPGIFDNPLLSQLKPRIPSAVQRAPVKKQDRFQNELQSTVNAPRSKPPAFWRKLSEVTREANEKGVDQWSAAYHKRFDRAASERSGVAFEGKDDDTLRDVEHFLYARDTASLGPAGFLQVAIGTPGHAALKALGIKKGDTSAEEVLRGLQGATVGFSEFLRNKFKR